MVYSAEITGGNNPLKHRATPGELTRWLKLQIPSVKVPQELGDGLNIDHAPYQIVIKKVGDEFNSVQNLPDPVLIDQLTELTDQPNVSEFELQVDPTAKEQQETEDLDLDENTETFEDLSSLTVEDAVNQVKLEENVSILEFWQQNETRKTVKAAVNNRLSELG